VVSLGKEASLHLCHYSPDEVYRGLHSTFQLTLEEYVKQLAEPIVITGHLHAFNARDIGGKQVYTVGSAGLPLKGTHQLEYAIVAQAAPDITAQIDGADRTKYLRYAASIISTMVSPEAQSATIKLVPRARSF